MKKIMIAAAIVCAAAFAQAGAVNWSSGAILNPEGAKVTTANASSLTMYVWESFTQSDVTLKGGELIKWYEGAQTTDPWGKTLTALSNTSTLGKSASTVTVNGTISDAAGTSTAYAAVLFVLEDKSGDIWYMENYGSAATKSGATAASGLNLGTKIGGTSTTAPSWVAAPEPTSAMLLLIGMAGLALRRRRA